MQLAFHMPTKVYFGTDCIAKNSAEFVYCGKRAMMVTGSRSAKISGALGDVQQALGDQGIDWTIFDQVEENPSLSVIEAGVQLARQYRTDTVIGIGGGSSLDAAKAIALLAANKMDTRHLFGGTFPVRPLPIMAVPITAGTGSEVTPYSILTDVACRTKRSISHPDMFPKASFLDARYTQSQPWTVTVNTAVDALSHAIEGYMSKRSNILSDHLALEAMRYFGRAIGSLKAHALTFEEREQLLYTSLMGGMVIAQTKTTMVHALGYSLTYFRNIPHGRANGLLMAEYLRFNQPVVPEKVSNILSALGLRTIAEFKMLMNTLLGHMEACAPEEIDEFAQIASQAASIENSPRQPTLDDLKQMLRDSYVLDTANGRL